MTSWQRTLAEAARSIRCAGGWTATAVSTAVLGTACIGTCVVERGGRRAHLIGRAWARLNMARMGCSVEAIGLDEIDPEQPYVVMANHRSYADVWAVLVAIPLQVRWVMKRELRDVPLFGVACERMGHVYVERGNRDDARASMAAAAERIRTGTSVFFFAEGTRSRDGQLLPFKKGGFRLALEATVPILPVSIAGTEQILPPGEWRYRRSSVTIVVGKPIPTAELDADALGDLMAQTRRAIETGLERAAPS